MSARIEWMQSRPFTIYSFQVVNVTVVRGRSQLSTFMKAYTVYARGREVGTTVRFSPENQHLFLITDNVL